MSIPNNHKAALFSYSETERVRYFQEGWSIRADGIYGPETAGALDEYIAQQSQDAPCNPSIRKAFESALADEGQREDPMGSNNGAYVEGLRDEVDLPRLGGGEWCAVFQSVHCTRAGINIKSRGAPGIVRAMIVLPDGWEVDDFTDIGPGFVGLALRKRGATTHHVQIFRAYMSDTGLRIQHVGGNEKHQVKSSHWKPEDFFRGVIQVATYGDQ